MGSSITEADIFEKKQDVLISPIGGMPCRKIAHFLKPIVSSPQDSKFKQSFIARKCRRPLDVEFNGWLDPLKNWSKWVDLMFSKYSDLWKSTGILEAILGSKYKFHRVDDLFFGIAERWNSDTNTLVFPWGEATITLEDMIVLGGFSVLGAPVFQPIEDADLSKICKKMSNVLIKKKIHTHLQWFKYYRYKKGKYEHEAFLSLWLSMFVFPGTERERIADAVFPIAVSLAKGTKFALAPAVLATIYRDISVLKASMDSSSVLAVSLWAPLYLVQIWAWERFIQFRPNPNPLKKDEPRAAMWHDLTRLEIVNVREIIDSSGDLFLWRPYCLSIDNWPFPMFYNENQDWMSIGLGQYFDNELESFVRCLRVCFLVAVDFGEPYYPHRVAMQFGFDQDIPEWIPRSKPCVKIAWYDYSRPFGIANVEKLELPPRLAESDVSIRYFDWWRKEVLLLKVGLVQKKRSASPEVILKFAPNAKRLKTDHTVTNEGFGFKPTCAESNVSSGNLIGLEHTITVTAVELDVTPGFLQIENGIPGSTQISNLELENGRMESPAEHQIKIADVPPGSPPNATAAEFNGMGEPSEVQHSKLQNTEEQQQSNEINVANEMNDTPEEVSRSSTSKVEASGILQPRTNACIELNPKSLSEMGARIRNLERILSKITNKKTNLVMK